MTVCIATICENGSTPNSQKIIMCADRQISAGINFESGVSKIKSLNEYCYVMMSSDESLKTDMVVERVKSIINGKTLKIEEIVKIFSKEYEEIIKSEREKAVLSKFGLNYKEFSIESKELSSDLLRQITASLINYIPAFESSIIIVGLDPQPHIYVINELGDYTSYDFLGFAVVGSGHALAFPEMTKYEPQHNPGAPLSLSLLRTYSAKKVAQRVGGVGPSTDLVVLHILNDKVIYWDGAGITTIMDKGIETVRLKEIDILNESIKELDKVFMGVKKSEEAKIEEAKTDSKLDETKKS